MLVRSSRYFDALVAQHDAEQTVYHVEATLRHLQRELREALSDLEQARIELRLNAARDEASALTIRQLKVEMEALRRELQDRTGDEYRARLHQNVIAHIPSADLSIEGILVGVYEREIVLRHASIPMSNGEVQTLAGDQVIPRSTVAWLSEPKHAVRAPAQT